MNRDVKDGTHSECAQVIAFVVDRAERLEGECFMLKKQRDAAWIAALSALALVWFQLLTGCAHPRETTPPPGEPCPAWEAGWMESRRDECDVWRCNAASLRWERLEVCE